MSGSIRLSLDIIVEDPGLLWAVVSDRLLAHPDMSGDDVADTIGPREDPDLTQCLLMLADPTRWPGCRVNAIDCHPLARR